MGEQTIETAEQLKAVVDRISFQPDSVVNLNWRIDGVPALEEGTNALTGWLMRVAFERPDTYTGKLETGFSRWEFVPVGATVSSAVKTCWVLFRLTIEHELMEAFMVDGKRIFNPHHTIDELAAIRG